MRIDTPVELDYYRNGGILQTVLRKLLAGLETIPKHIAIFGAMKWCALYWAAAIVTSLWLGRASLSHASEFYIAFWNVENLFDLEDDPAVELDEDFTPQAPKRWTQERLEIKLNNLVQRHSQDERRPRAGRARPVRSRESQSGGDARGKARAAGAASTRSSTRIRQATAVSIAP